MHVKIVLLPKTDLHLGTVRLTRHERMLCLTRLSGELLALALERERDKNIRLLLR